jgi:polysaccharide biosynthesis protein PslH
METVSGSRKKIFVLLSRVPWPLEKGDKLRAYYQLRELSKNHDIILCALNEGPIHPDALKNLQPITREIHCFPLNKLGIFWRVLKNWFSSKPFQVAYFHHPGIQRKIHELIRKHQPDHIYCQLIRTAEYVRHLGGDKTIDYQDVFSKGLERRKRIAPWYLKPVLQAEYRRVLRYEAKVFDCFNKKTIISVPDRDNIPHPQKEAIEVIPNGVDTSFFKPRSGNQTFDLIFSGNMGYPPNINGAEYLVKQVMPLVWQQQPKTTLVLAGASPALAVKALAGPMVTVTGWVDDMRDYYAGSRIFIAPMQIGTGLQNKVLEAMAMRLPCITSPLANKALEAQNGHEILTGNNPEEFAQHILSLLNDPEKRNALADNGYNFVHQHFNWESVCRRLDSIITGDH